MRMIRSTRDNSKFVPSPSTDTYDFYMDRCFLAFPNLESTDDSEMGDRMPVMTGYDLDQLIAIRTSWWRRYLVEFLKLLS